MPSSETSWQTQLTVLCTARTACKTSLSQDSWTYQLSSSRCVLSGNCHFVWCMWPRLRCYALQNACSWAVHEYGSVSQYIQSSAAFTCDLRSALCCAGVLVAGGLCSGISAAGHCVSAALQAPATAHDKGHHCITGALHPPNVNLAHPCFASYKHADLSALHLLTMSRSLMNIAPQDCHGTQHRVSETGQSADQSTCAGNEQGINISAPLD